MSVAGFGSVTALGQKIYSVGEICRDIKRVLENQFAGGVWIEGEISNLRVPSSGHVYFSLKDSESLINAVMFRESAGRLLFAPANGLKVLIFGSLGIYESRGIYQVVVARMEPQGLGSLQLAFQQLKAKLDAEGLFDAARKKTLPMLPQRIAIVTSPTGAAIRDILHVLERRFSNLHISIYPVQVQGEGAAAMMAAALRDLNELRETKPFDLILITRGGGSLEDLWPFNEEQLARAVAASAIPVVSAVGHQVDTTICDMVADMRCATPSAAAEMIIGCKQDLLSHVDALSAALNATLENVVGDMANRLQWATRPAGFAEPGRLVERYVQRVDDALGAVTSALQRQCDVGREKFQYLAGKLDALSPLAVLGRGYSITFWEGRGRVLRKSQDVAVGESLRTRLGQGQIVSTVSRVE